MTVPFSGSNIFAIDADQPGLFTTDANGVILAKDAGPSGNDFANNHTANTQPQLSNGELVFFTDHLHRGPSPNGLVPEFGDWTFVTQCSFSFANNSAVFSQGCVSPGSYLIVRSLHGQIQAIIEGGRSLKGLFVTENQFYTITFIRSGNTLTLRNDGSQVEQKTKSSGFNVRHDGNLIGGYSGGNSYDPPNSYYRGSVKRIGLWSGTPDPAVLEQWALEGGTTELPKTPIAVLRSGGL